MIFSSVCSGFNGNTLEDCRGRWVLVAAAVMTLGVVRPPKDVREAAASKGAKCLLRRRQYSSSWRSLRLRLRKNRSNDTRTATATTAPAMVATMAPVDIPLPEPPDEEEEAEAAVEVVEDAADEVLVAGVGGFDVDEGDFEFRHAVLSDAPTCIMIVNANKLNKIKMKRRTVVTSDTPPRLPFESTIANNSCVPEAMLAIH
jgi:hypothetical protein